MEQAPEKLPTYQQTIGYALAYSSVPAACQMLQVMHHRGTLDISERDEDGYNVIDRFLERASLCAAMLDTIDALEASESYTQPHEGRFIAMDRQIAWVRQPGAHGAVRHSSQGAYEKRPDEALARMVECVDEQWFQEKGWAYGAKQVARLVACPQNVPAALDACWKRGVDPNVRKPDSALAIDKIQHVEAFKRWIQAGGDVNARVSDARNYPIWQLWADRADRETSGRKQISHIREAVEGRVDETDLHDACQFMVARRCRSSQADMLKTLNGIEGWMHKDRYTGTPIWLAAVRLRPALLDNLLDRKRARPDFTQRDAAGRSAWFAAIACRVDETFDKLEAQAPFETMARDSKGRGLLAQIVASQGGLGKLAKKSSQWKILHGCLQQMMRRAPGDRGMFTDGMDAFGPDQLDGSDQKDICPLTLELVVFPGVCSHMNPDTCIKMLDATFRAMGEPLTNFKPTPLQAAGIKDWVLDLCNRQARVPTQDWIGMLDAMGQGWRQEINELARGLHGLLVAQQSRTMLHDTTAKVGVDPGRNTLRL